MDNYRLPSMSWRYDIKLNHNSITSKSTTEYKYKDNSSTRTRECSYDGDMSNSDMKSDRHRGVKKKSPGHHEEVAEVLNDFDNFRNRETCQLFIYPVRLIMDFASPYLLSLLDPQEYKVLDKEKYRVAYYYVFNTLLFSLLVLHVYWWVLMFRMLVKQIQAKGQLSEDVRSGKSKL